LAKARGWITGSLYKKAVKFVTGIIGAEALLYQSDAVRPIRAA
jgi:hypothetical protein